METKESLFIGGTWQEPCGSGTIDVISPVTEQVFARVPEGTTEDIDRAVSAARRAFDDGPWPRMHPAERAKVLGTLAGLVNERHVDLAQAITSQNGCPILVATHGQALAGPAILSYYEELAQSYPFEESRPGMMGEAVVRREPVGVVAAIVPWNAPLLIILMKLAPALAAGCTVVVKPAPETPLDSYILGECLEKAGLPEGVVSIVTAGRDVGQHLVTHPGVDKVSFTGSTDAGRRIASLCGDRIRRVTLELGGKSAAIICEDADIASAVATLVPTGLLFNGQACAAQTRILAPRSRYDEIVDGFVETMGALTVGDPMDETTAIGPLVAERQRDRVEGYIATGRAEGARVALGGGRPAHLDTGWFVEPTLFVDVDNKMRIAQEEIFGPVISVIPYEDEEEAIAIANDSVYGLNGTVWTSDSARGQDIARRVDTGSITVNGFNWEMNCPTGGFKGSGIGRECGPEGLEAFLEQKTIYTADPSAALFSG